MSAAPAIAPDAAIVLGIASTAMPFARTPEEAAERWLRVLRLNGEVGAVLQSLGVSEGPLQPPGEDSDREQAGAAGIDHHDAVSHVTEHAVHIARERGATAVATTDVLMAVMRVYGADFDRVLQAHGTDRDEVIEQLGANALGRTDG
jgi:arginyl-tRNA synthetase